MQVNVKWWQFVSSSAEKMLVQKIVFTQLINNNDEMTIYFAQKFREGIIKHSALKK